MPAADISLRDVSRITLAFKELGVPVSSLARTTAYP